METLEVNPLSWTVLKRASNQAEQSPQVELRLGSNHAICMSGKPLDDLLSGFRFDARHCSPLRWNSYDRHRRLLLLICRTLTVVQVQSHNKTVKHGLGK